MMTSAITIRCVLSFASLPPAIDGGVRQLTVLEQTALLMALSLCLGTCIVIALWDIEQARARHRARTQTRHTTKAEADLTRRPEP
jgi:hypothetical protein